MSSNSASEGSTESVRPTDPSHPGRCNVLILSFLSFVVVVFGVWLVSAGARYRAEYAQAMEGWRVGSTRVVELTLVKDDRRNLACAADPLIEGLHCGYRADQQTHGTASDDDPLILQPYNTVGNELLLGAGLWLNREMQGSLPEHRFSVLCTYHIKGVMKSAAIRFAPTAAFGPIEKSITVGTLTECTLPR